MSITLPQQWEYLSAPKEPEVKIWVTVGDKVLSIFKKDATDEAKITCDITGVEGKEYKVHFYDGRDKLNRPYECLLRLDGEEVASNWHRKEDPLYVSPKDSKGRLTTWSTRKDHRNQKRSLAFGKIPTTEDVSKAAQDPSVLSSAGTICVEYSRIKSIRDTRPTKRERYERQYDEMYPMPWAPEKDLVAEDSKKAATHLSAAGQGSLVASNGRKNFTKPKSKETTYEYSDVDVPYLTYTLRVCSSVMVQDELFLSEESNQPIASTSAAYGRKRSSSAIDEDDEDGDGDIEAQLKILEEKKARLLAKKAKTSDIKPRVSPGPPFDWEGRPPIDKGKRVYIDFDEEGAEEEEKRMLEREKLEKEKRERDQIEL
ncbi:hypothetical protein JCM5353_000320 [Sporobolomyces roseus]